MGKYLRAIFLDAKFTPSHSESKSVALNAGVIFKHKNQPQFREPIVVNHISNMLHVLFGFTPVPSFRDVFYKPIPYIMEKAMNTYLRMNLWMLNGKMITETVHTAKALKNSWQESTDMTMERLKRYLSDTPELLLIFKAKIYEVLHVDMAKLTFPELIKLMRPYQHDVRFIEMFDMFKKQRKSALYQAIFATDRRASDINMHRNTILTTPHGIEQQAVFSGSLYIPVTDEDIEHLRKYSSGYTTLLDGGLVCIEEIVYDDEFDIQDFKLMKDISLELINNKNDDDNDEI
jgi:hypothetical protein